MNSMRMFGGAVAAVALIGLTSLPSAGADGEMRSATGAMSTVTLVDVSRLPPELLGPILPGAEDGLVFMFLIVKNPTAQGEPTVRELRDFEVGDASYQGSTARKLGQEIAPVVLIEEVNAFLERVDPGSSQRMPAAMEGQAYIMVATIGGVKLEDLKDGEISLDVGFGGNTEHMPFTFRVPPAPAPGSTVVPALPGNPGNPGNRSVPDEPGVPAVPRSFEGSQQT